MGKRTAQQQCYHHIKWSRATSVSAKWSLCAAPGDAGGSHRQPLPPPCQPPTPAPPAFHHLFIHASSHEHRRRSPPPCHGAGTHNDGRASGCGVATGASGRKQERAGNSSLPLRANEEWAKCAKRILLGIGMARHGVRVEEANVLWHCRLGQKAMDDILWTNTYIISWKRTNWHEKVAKTVAAFPERNCKTDKLARKSGKDSRGIAGLLNMEAFQARPGNQTEVSAQREVSAPRRSLPFARISHGLSVPPPTQQGVSARRNFPFGIISSALSVPRPPPPSVKPPLPPVHNVPNYVGGHQASFGPYQSDYASIDDQQQMALPPAKEITVRKPTKQKKEKKEEKQQKKEKPKWKF
ncbi:hypothetical protein niasHT_035086 [Heterodera trifolii]|uniref:Uncharacterized protein n=1 Tax=Heterodera trifolii TaxID=157864 RepID=A0ABD2IZ39_9BILA